MKKILFVCSENRLRSPTAERIFKDYKDIEVRSAGLSEESRVMLNEKLLKWADLIFVMEDFQKDIIKKRFPNIKKTVIVLDIDDIYDYMDPVLIKLLKEKTKKFF